MKCLNKLILLVNHKGQKQCKEPIKTQMNTFSQNEVLKKGGGVHESHWFCFHLCYLDKNVVQGFEDPYEV